MADPSGLRLRLGLDAGIVNGIRFCYTQIAMACVKTAISMDEGLFLKVDRMAQELKIPRSRLFVMAMQEFVERRRNQELLEQLNKAYEGHPDPEEREYLSHVKQRYAARIQEEDTW